MRVLGAAPASDHVNLVVLEVNSETWSVVDTRTTRKIRLGHHGAARNLHDFRDAVEAFINSHGVDLLLIRRCTYSGRRSSGAPAIKMETLLQLIDCDSRLVPAQTVSSAFKKHGVAVPEGLKKYQELAFATAMSAVKVPDGV